MNQLKALKRLAKNEAKRINKGLEKAGYFPVKASKKIRRSFT